MTQGDSRSTGVDGDKACSRRGLELSSGAQPKIYDQFSGNRDGSGVDLGDFFFQVHVHLGPLCLPCWPEPEPRQGPLGVGACLL